VHQHIFDTVFRERYRDKWQFSTRNGPKIRVWRMPVINGVRRFTVWKIYLNGDWTGGYGYSRNEASALKMALQAVSSNFVFFN
jgi:hypothetical protein